MSNARTIIDRLVEEQEHAVVRVELTGSPKTVQQALKQLAKQKGGLKKAVGDAGSVKISEPKVEPAKGGDKPADKKDDKGGKPAFGKKPADKKADDKDDGDDE
jgi:hypothetical protein